MKFKFKNGEGVDWNHLVEDGDYWFAVPNFSVL